jgi:hypothetical protein
MNIKNLYVIAVAGVMATALACGDKSPSPAAPSPAANSTGSETPATADGTTLKVPPPPPVSPANGATLEDFNIVLKVNSVTAKYADVSQFAYHFQILLNNQVVREFRTSTTTQWTVTDLDSNTTYTWHARAEQGNYFGPWSDSWTFKTPEIPEGYINGGELYDPLYNGKTVGQPVGPVTFIPGVGVKLESLKHPLPHSADGDGRRVLYHRHQHDLQHRGRQDEGHVHETGRERPGHHGQRSARHVRKARQPRRRRNGGVAIHHQ